MRSLPRLALVVAALMIVPLPRLSVDLHGRMFTTQTDDFNRADSSDLGTNWVKNDSPDTMYISSNTAVGQYPTNTTNFKIANYWNTATYTFAADQCSQAKFVTFDNTQGYAAVLVRGSISSPASSNPTSYTAYSNGTIYLENGVAGPTLLATGTVYSTGDTAKICVTGTTITSYINGSVNATVTDSTLSTGQPGMAPYSGNVGVTVAEDDWVGTDGGGGGPTFPPAILGVAPIRCCGNVRR